MKARVISTPGTTTLHLTPGKAARPRTVSTPRWRRCAQKRVLAGLCRDCARPRRRFKHRCDRCQTKENTRFRAKHNNKFATMPAVAKRSRMHPTAKEREFLKDLDGWARVGWDPVERIRRRRRHKE